MSARKYLLSAPVGFTAPTIPELCGYDPDAQTRLGEMVDLWRVKQPRNKLRQAYLDGIVRPDNLNVAVPDEMVDQLGAVIGWPRKVVFGLSDLLIWNGVTATDSEENPYGLVTLLKENQFDLEVSQTIASALTQSVAFLTVRKGRVEHGDPAVVLQGHSAQWATGIWDRPRRRLSYGLTIDDVDQLGHPTAMTLYCPYVTLGLEGTGGLWAVTEHDEHQIPRPAIEAMPFEPSLDRPMGRSRIGRDVMSITQRAMRTVLREELATELFTAPGLLLRGVEGDVIEDLRSWTWKLGTVKTISKDEDGDTPEVTVLPQQSSQPFTEQMRALATELAGVSSLPVSSLGVVQDNPSSAEALYAAKEELIIKARNAQRVFDSALRRIYQDAVMLRDGLSEVPEALHSLATRWGDPANPSVVSQSDAIIKQISALPWLADSPVVLELLGYSDEVIQRLLSDKRRAEAGGVLNRILAQSAPAADAPQALEGV